MFHATHVEVEEKTKMEEIFIPVNSLEQARQVETLNSTEAAEIKRQRQAFLAQQGEATDHQLPDVAAVRERALAHVAFLDKITKATAQKPKKKQQKQKKQKLRPRQLDVVLDTFELHLKNHVGHIKVDGQELRRVKRVTIDCEAAKTPTVVVEFLP